MLRNKAYKFRVYPTKEQEILINKTFLQVDTYYPSSQICSRCGSKNVEMKDLKIREYKCSKCGIEIDRDKNASINIEYEGIIKYFKNKYAN